MTPRRRRWLLSRCAFGIRESRSSGGAAARLRPTWQRWRARWADVKTAAEIEVESGGHVHRLRQDRLERTLAGILGSAYMDFLAEDRKAGLRGQLLRPPLAASIFQPLINR